MRHWLILLLSLTAVSAAFGEEPMGVGKSLQEGEQFLVSGYYDEALEACRCGVKVLGDAYYSSEVIDDTDLKLMAADLQQQEGKLENAASVTCHVLRIRLELWEAKYGSGTKNSNSSFNSDAFKARPLTSGEI